MDTRKDAQAPITEDELHALVDGRLPPDAAAALRERLVADPQAQATVDAWQAQRAALRGTVRADGRSAAARRRWWQRPSARNGPTTGPRSGGAGAAWPRRCCWRSAWAGSPAPNGAARTAKARWRASNRPGSSPSRRPWRMPCSSRRCGIRSKSPPPSRSTWSNGCPSGWAARSRCRSWRPKDTSSWAAGCCRATAARAPSSCTRTAPASGSRSIWARWMQAPAAPRGKPHSASWTTARCRASTGWTRGSATPSRASCRGAALQDLATAVYRQL